MRLTPVLLAAGAGALGAAASAHPQPLDVSPAHTAHSLEARSPLSLSIGGINLCIGLFCHRPSRSWKCSGSGRDGYSVDYNGNTRPSWAPASFLWFGADVGWAPPKGFSCGTSWQIPSAMHGKLDLITWWTPPSSWLDAHVGVDLGFKVPSFWGLILAPSKGWTCSGNGKDGFSVDIHGGGRPSSVPVGWLYFGSSIGWAPPVGWSCSSSFEFPSAFLDVAHLVTWWKPSSGWLDAHVGVDLGFKVPSFWGLILAPSKGWTCSGNGKDGFSVDIHGGGRPSSVPVGWLYFGSSIGWAPPVGWSCSSSFELPSAFIEIIHLVTWWKPSNAWIDAHAGVGLSFTPPPWWGIAITPSKSWQCNGGGRDGYPVDSNGQAAPLWVPSSGWAWFGASVGWQPVSCPSTWAIPSQWRKTCSKATWWTPPSIWITKHKSHDFGFSLPTHWGVDKCGCSCGCGAGDAGITTTSRAPASTSIAHTTTTARATTTSAKPVTSSASTSKPATTSKKPATTSSSKPSSTTSKKLASTSTSHKPATTTSSKPAATTTSKKPSMPTSKPVTTSKAGTTKTVTYIGDASTVTIPGGIVTVTRTVSISQPEPTGRPSQGWSCDGSGKDGYEVDWKGNGRPAEFPEGWYWFGVSSWQPSSLQVTVIISSQISWWLPPPSFKLPSSVDCPTHWTSQGWIDTRIPSASWQCNGSGEDGYDFDHQGHGRPSGATLGWKWYGRTHGWQPCKSFQLPSADYSPPSWWVAHRATWWRPTSRWNLRSHRSFKCPTFWRSSRSHLRGSWIW
ncbi:uncharacterized protein RHOBADRAFT_52078 [Rhodotorula graminis WP1]|uniref:Uncharacterized protein n=1 Tax=Rhodotorula graminis (strain WP1) TaxID=578459 RepID=A0A194S8S4_RHOGW|nr:uncharacterized protein RHOBADRAFT_52078 [Rhodotorula graminis WP1]KPV77128.1 hypothetical protein RHOBADRAFT_52078 [Rhodotorula graminis WP1]